MRKAFKYRIYPNKEQEKALVASLDACRWLYNHFLEERKVGWETDKKSFSKYGQDTSIKQLKEEHPFLENAYSQSLQNVSARIDLAFRAFFRRVKKGEKPGYPRFRGKFRYDSFTYPQMGFCLHDNFVRLSKIGCVKIRKHRDVEGTIKTCTVRRTQTGKWFVTFACNIEKEVIKQPPNPATGIDMGISKFVTFSNGETIENPKFFRKEEKALVKAQRKFSKQEKDSLERKKARKVVARVHERITNKRHNFAHQESRKIVNSFNTIVAEALSIKSMTKNNFRNLNKSIQDASWNMFLNCIEYKAEDAGKQLVRVNPAYTSQTCSHCGHRQKLKLSERMYKCSKCDLSLDRDHNAAINILTLGTQSLQSPSGELIEATCFSR